MSWVALTGPHLDRLAARLGLGARSQELRGAMYTPSWYSHGALLRLQIPWEYAAAFIAAGTREPAERQLFALNGRSQPVHAGNQAAGIMIRTPEDATDYLRFFCASIDGGEGRFNIVDGPVPGWIMGGFDPAAIKPPQISAADTPGLFTGQAWMEYAGGLFVADFSIRADGTVEMTDDEPVGRLLPDAAARSRMESHDPDLSNVTLSSPPLSTKLCDRNVNRAARS